MTQSLKFGTSGLRGLAAELNGEAARRYVGGFLRHLRKEGRLGGGRVYLARDLRPSSPDILAECASAVVAEGLVAVDCGALPTPALALHAMAEGGPAIMVTGSHIPADRNGLKFYGPGGEISKADEAGITAALPETGPEGARVAVDGFAPAGDRYRQRYRHFLKPGALENWRIGVFEHSSVARDLLVSLLTRAGAAVVRLQRAEAFVPVDTEALNDDIYLNRHSWVAEHHLDAVVSTDGDGDRPLLIDGEANFVRGDVLGLLAARLLQAETVVTPVTSNSALEADDGFRHVRRTRVGSPHVIAGMAAAAARGGTVVGFEANGGVLLGSEVIVNGRRLAPLPTRDAVLPLLAALGTAAGQGVSLADLVRALPMRAALSDRLAEVPPGRSGGFLERLSEDRDYAVQFFAPVGEIESVSTLDGPRFSLVSGDVVHYRASGNAPELRCYVEGVSAERAEELLRWGMASAASVVR